MKSEYLIVHDYGMGGVWGVMSARSPTEITKKYPGVKIISTRPSWMPDDEYNRIRAETSWDVDDPPTGWLSHL